MNEQVADRLFIKRLCNNAALTKRGTEGLLDCALSAAQNCIIPAEGKRIVKTGLAISFHQDCMQE